MKQQQLQVQREQQQVPAWASSCMDSRHYNALRTVIGIAAWHAGDHALQLTWGLLD
jgi:hypothetical protein